MMIFKTIKQITLAALVMSSFSAVAQMPYGYGGPQGNGYKGANNGMPYNVRPQNYGQMNNRSPYGNPYARPYGMPYGAPYQNNNGFNRFFNSSPFGNRGGYNGRNGMGEQFWPGKGSVYDDVLPANGPWNRSWGRAPWNRNYDDMWGRKGGPQAWFDPTDPKESMAQAWEDMLVTPNGLGTMPGGWKAPSISVPNPIDVGDEFKNVAKDMPDEMQNFSEGFTYGDESWNGSDGNNGGGISFDPGRRR